MAMPLLNIFGDLERFTTEELYPYRYVITPLLIAAGLGALYFAYRLGAHLWIKRNPLISAGIGVPLVVVALFAGNYFLSPLWERSYLEEESPLAAIPVEASAATTVPDATSAPASTMAPDSPEPTATSEATGGGAAPSTGGQAPSTFQPSVAYSGNFVGADDFHFGRGDALIIETEPGKYVLRFENFSVRNGPDLFVYLSEDPTGETITEALNLGELKATDGAFNYEIPPEIDVSRIKSAVVWCRQFSVLFTHAELM
jgi:hypothetical protein